MSYDIKLCDPITKKVIEFAHRHFLTGGTYIKSNAAKFRASLDVYYLLVQNFVHVIGSEFRKKGKKWKIYTNNSIAFICSISDFPLELKKSYIDQLCQMDEKINRGKLISKYIYNDSCNKQVSELIQELDYIK